jgi:hypothetical protein
MPWASLKEPARVPRAVRSITKTENCRGKASGASGWGAVRPGPSPHSNGHCYQEHLRHPLIDPFMAPSLFRRSYAAELRSPVLSRKRL